MVPWHIMTLLETRHDKVHFIPLDQIHRMQGLLNMDLAKCYFTGIDKQINRLGTFRATNKHATGRYEGTHSYEMKVHMIRCKTHEGTTCIWVMDLRPSSSKLCKL